MSAATFMGVRVAWKNAYWVYMQGKLSLQENQDQKPECDHEARGQQALLALLKKPNTKAF